MVRNVKTGEIFATFSFDGKDCADMGIYSVTSGSVYSMNIEPTFSDNKKEVPGYDGKYYYGTQITGQQFQFHCFAHDLLTTEYNRLKAWLNPRRIGKLILSDQPYKYYLVKPVSISALGAYPLTTVQTPDYSVLGDYSTGDVVYTGNFTVTFETVGSAYGYGVSYYRDDLIYDASLKYGRDYYYNSGLLYADMSPKLRWTIKPNTKDQEIPIYNPGNAYGRPIYTIKTKTPFSEGAFIQINNRSTGTSTTIDLSGLSGEITIDTSAQTIMNGDKVYYGRFNGTALIVNPYESVIELPESFVENVENTQVLEYDSFYIQDNIVSVNPKILKVTDKMIGQYFCVNHNGGARITGVDIEQNTLQLDGTYTQNIPRAQVDANTGILIKPAGVAFNYIEVNNKKPEEANENDICVVDNIWYRYMNGEWKETNLFNSKVSFKNIYGDYITKYRMFGATIVLLDELTITTGTNIKDKGGATGASIGEFELIAELQPRYL